MYFRAVFQSVELLQNSGSLSNTVAEQLHRKHAVSMVSADMGLVSMVRQGILALQLLPPNSSSGQFNTWYNMLVSDAPTVFIVAGKAGESFLDSNFTNNLSNPNRKLGSCDGKTWNFKLSHHIYGGARVPHPTLKTHKISANVRQNHGTLPLILHTESIVLTQYH